MLRGFGVLLRARLIGGGGGVGGILMISSAFDGG